MKTDYHEEQRRAGWTAEDWALAGGIDPFEVSRFAPGLSADDRRVLWHLQYLSAEAGGLASVAEDLLSWYPERCQTDTMRKAGKPPGGVYGNEEAGWITRELDCEAVRFWPSGALHAWESYDDGPFGLHPGKDRELYESEEANMTEAAQRELRFCPIPEAERTATYFTARCQARLRSGLPRQLLNFLRTGEVPSSDYWQGLSATLADWERRRSQAAKEAFYLTNVGREVWATLDYCLAERKPVFIQGREGRGKTEAVKAWLAAHRGEARGMTAPGLGRKQDVFRRLATGLRRPGEATGEGLQGWVEAVLTRSGLMLVIDEAHFLLKHRAQGGRPGLLDWIDEALSDRGVPVALVATPQFAVDMAAAQKRTGWNAEQFKRRFVRRWTVLPEITAREDLDALAKRLLPGVSDQQRSRALDALVELGRDVSGLGDLASEACLQARLGGRELPSASDFKSAVNVCLANEVALDRALSGGRELPPEAPTPTRRGQPSVSPQGARKPVAARSRGAGTREFSGAGIGAECPRVPALDG